MPFSSKTILENCSCCFGFRGNLEIPDLVKNSFITSTTGLIPRSERSRTDEAVHLRLTKDKLDFLLLVEPFSCSLRPSYSSRCCCCCFIKNVPIPVSSCLFSFFYRIILYRIKLGTLGGIQTRIA